MKWFLLAIVALAACDPCVDGVCPRYDLSTPYPGPCESAYARELDRGTDRTHCTYEYDGTRVATIECQSTNEYGEGGFEKATWAYDAGGQPVSIAWSLRSEGTISSRWQLDTDPITYSEGLSTPSQERSAYDRATFAFLPIVGSGVAKPRAELGLIRARDETFTWSGSGKSLTRTGSAGRITTFELDDRGHIVNSHDDQPSFDLMTDETWTFDGDQLRKDVLVVTVQSGTTTTTTTYSYDHAGNIAESNGEVYAYECW